MKSSDTARMFYLVLKEIKCHMEIGDAVTSGKKLDTQISLAGINPLCQSMSRQLWFLGSCMMSLSGLVQMAHFSNPAACFSFSGQQEYHIGAGLTWEETKGLPSEQQGQFTVLDAAIHFWRHLARAHQCTSLQFQCL
ncbi:hypothetical protein EMCRGX_G002021 [Ephydatia muelleri]